MPWFALDDQGSFHEKVLAAGNEAYGAWCRAGQWSSAKLTDGRLPRHVALAIAPIKIWLRLEKVGLCDPTGGDDFQIHDFLDYNPSAAEVLSKREARATAGRVGGKTRAARQVKMADDPAAESDGVLDHEKPTPNEDNCPDSLNRGQANASANVKQVLKQSGLDQGQKSKQNSTPRARLPDPGSHSSAPTERAPGEPTPSLPGSPSRSEMPVAPTEGAQGSLGFDGPARETPPRSQTRRGGGDGQDAAPPEPETPLGVGWRTWRAAYQAKYRRGYPGRGPAGQAMQDIARAAVEHLRELGRPPGELEYLLNHWWERFLEDHGMAKAGSEKGFLDERGHALQFFMQSVAKYGSPWDDSVPQSTTHVVRDPPKPMVSQEHSSAVAKQHLGRLMGGLGHGGA